MHLATNRRPNSGSIFVLCLWILTALSIFAIGLSVNVRQKALVTQRLSARELIRDMLDGAVIQFIMESRQSGSSKTAIWYNPNLVARTYAFARGSVRLEIEDMSDRINANTAEAYVLTNLLRGPGALDKKEANRLACAILDYRDQDDLVREFGDQGSERDLYGSAGLEGGLRNRPFEFERQLLQVKGMTKEIYDDIKNYITIYGSGSININTASGEALSAIDLPTELVEKILRLRKESGAGKGKSFIFTNIGKIKADLAAGPGLTDAEATALDHAIQYAGLTVVASCYKIHAMAALANPKATGELWCIYSFDKGIQIWGEK